MAEPAWLSAALDLCRDYPYRAVATVDGRWLVVAVGSFGDVFFVVREGDREGRLLASWDVCGPPDGSGRAATLVESAMRLTWEEASALGERAEFERPEP